MAKRRVVVTGLGVISSIGISKTEFWKNLVAGKSGISDVTTFDVSGFDIRRGGEVKNFDVSKYISKERIIGVARASQFAIAATKLAIEDAGIELKNIKKNRTGVIIGTTMADIQSLEEIDKYWTAKGEDEVWAINVVKYPGSGLASHVSSFYSFSGPSYVVPTACAAGNYSIGYAYDIIRRNKADMMFAGGADPFSRITFTGFSRLYAMAPEKCQPFDKNRKGMMVGEGAGMLLLEDLESARKRQANIYAEVLGYGLSCDANHMTAPRVAGVAKVMMKAMSNSNVGITSVNYICAHGTGTPVNDRTECEAIKTIFGEHSRSLVVNSLKSMLGHTMGAASAIEAIACCLSIYNDVVPPTINFETPDPECDIDCVPNKAREMKVSRVLNNSLAFGGNNACVVLGEINE